MADFAFLGLELPAACGPRHPTGRSGDPTVETGTLAGNEKALQRRRTIVFVDESGLTETAAPGSLLVSSEPISRAAIFVQLEAPLDHCWNYNLELLLPTLRRQQQGPQVIQFLEHPQWHIGSRLTIIWDRLPVHRSRLVRDFVTAQRGKIELEFLPAYTPELDPGAYIWSHCK